MPPVAVWIKREALVQAAANRPAGYLEDVLARSMGHDDQYVLLSPEVYAELRAAYSSPAPFAERVVNFAKSVVGHVASGMKLCPQDEIDRRFAICQGCEFYKDGSCLKCGCPLVREKKFISKLSWANETCPVGKWGPAGHSSVGPDASAR